MGQVNCEKKLALAWSQQQSQALAGLQGCLGLCRWQVPTGLNLPPLDTIPACQGSQLGRVSSETPVPVGNRMVPGTLMSTCQQRLAAWEARVAPVCTGPLCSIPAGVGWQQPQHLRVSVEDSLPGLRSYPAGCQQVVRHRRHSTGQRVSFQCTACLWRREHEAGRPHLSPHSGCRERHSHLAMFSMSAWSVRVCCSPSNSSRAL